jgi:16S rRNA (uracil1498-N3)-methyltransferase
VSRRRLFVPAERLGGARLTIDGDDHRYVARVLRGRPGDRLALFDGAGTEVDAEIIHVGPRDAELALGERRTVPSGAAAVAVTLLVAVPRGERMDLLVQKTTELGVARIVPVVAGRSVVRPEAKARARWEKIAREAARQCGRADVPRVEAPDALATALGDAELPALRFALWEGEHGRGLRAALVEAFGAPVTGVTRPGTAVLVGPEGGFEPTEVEQARAAGFVPVGLGPRILRVETAAIAAVTLIQAFAGGLD